MSASLPPVAPVESHAQAARPRAKGRYEIALDCVHCGLCLQVCPTYLELGDEADSPRGRIYLMRAYEEGRQSVTRGLVDHLDRCLVCRACETACPSGVRFGSMMEDFRSLVRTDVERLAEAEGTPAAARFRAALAKLVLVHVVPRRRLLRALVEGLRFYQWSGLGRVARRSGALRVLGLERQEEQAPLVPPRAARRSWPEVVPPVGQRRARVLFLRGCVTPELLPEMVEASIEALRYNGCEVVTPRQQTCCGALHFHTGHKERGLDLLAQNVRAFDLRDVDAIVVNAAGCGSSLKEYGELAAGRPDVASSAALFADRVRDIHEFLDGLGLVAPRYRIPARVAYDEPCHLLHGQRVTEPPKAILRAVPGVELVPLRDADRCCGSAGVYNVAQPVLAGAILAEKIRNVAASGCDVVATGNPGCILQMRAGLRRAAASDPRLGRIRVMHPIEILAASYRGPGAADSGESAP